MADHPLWKLRDRGQGVWVRHLRRRLVESGALDELIATSAVSGIESDLGVLAAAVARGAEYRPVLERLAAGEDIEEVVEGLLAEEARLAADALAGVYESSAGRDGYVSIDVLPQFAEDADELTRAVLRMMRAIERRNVMVRVPPTGSAFAVLETMTADGFHVHVGPVFTVSGLARAAQAFVNGARRHLASGAGAGDLAALVSFGLAPLEIAIDDALRERIRESEGDTSSAESLLGNGAVAVAKVGCRRQRQVLDRGLGPERRADGPRMMRLLWTDVATHDPRARDARYVESLIGPDTAVSMSLVSLRAFRDRGVVDATLGQWVDEAAEFLGELESFGIDIEAVGRELEDRVAADQTDAYDALVIVLEAAAEALAADPRDALAAARSGAPWINAGAEVPAGLVAGLGGGPSGGPSDGPVGGLSGGLSDGDPGPIRRLWDKDASLWGGEQATQELIRNRLGWLDIVDSMRVECEPALRFARRVRDSDVEDVVLLGMGGSSVFADACRRIFGAAYFKVLDSTLPAEIRRVAGRIDLARTLFVVASKSGTTIETRALADHFYAQTTPMLESPGERFVAITDPGTPLEQVAHERGFQHLWLAPPDVGGRFSALSHFGVLPMALMGIDAGAVLESAWSMAVACSPEVELAANPGARLGHALHGAWAGGRDKLTFLCGEPVAPFAAWAEQLVAESTGKDGVGLVPVVDEPAAPASDYGDDRLFVGLRLAGDAGDAHEALLEALEADGHPVLRFVLRDRHEIGAELFRWQVAIGVAGALMGINPYDEPDVQDSKERTAALLAAQQEGEPVADRAPLDAGAGWAVFADLERDAELASRQRGDGLGSWLAAHLGRAELPDYIGLQAFIAGDGRSRASLASLRRLLVSRLGVATTLGWGPGFLHSTGQLHKGGPAHGLFVQITADDAEDLDCSGHGYSFATLARAQALGDLKALQERGRRVLRIHLRDAATGLDDLLETARQMFGES
ncbi:MAG TPA: transaldolase family protein [Acidobacteriota bacterium]